MSLTRVVWLPLCLALAAVAQVNFDNLPAGAVPPNWTRVETASGAARLQVHRDPTAPSRPNVFEESASGPHEAGFPLLYDKVVCNDGDLSVKFRISPGRADQTAGIVFRYRDPLNYYLLNFSVDQKSIGLVRVTNGRFEPLRAHGGEPHDLRAGQWYVAKLVFRGTKVRVLFGNRQLFEVQDSRLQGSGKTGVWTQGQTKASFDDFRIDRKS